MLTAKWQVSWSGVSAPLGKSLGNMPPLRVGIPLDKGTGLCWGPHYLGNANFDSLEAKQLHEGDILSTITNQSLVLRSSSCQKHVVKIHAFFPGSILLNEYILCCLTSVCSSVIQG